MHDEPDPDRHLEGMEGIETVTVELDEETIEAVEDVAFTDHRGNHAAAIRSLLDEWLRERE
jgi:hypothetical protein